MRQLTAGFALLAITLSCRTVMLGAQAQAPAPPAEHMDDAPRYVPPPAWKSVEIGDFYLRKKDYPGALSRFEEAVETDPDYAPAYLGLGKVYEKTGRKKDALSAYRKYLDALSSEKQAQEAAGVHKAIRRLERDLNRDRRSQLSLEKSHSGAR